MGVWAGVLGVQQKIQIYFKIVEAFFEEFF